MTPEEELRLQIQVPMARYEATYGPAALAAVVTAMVAKADNRGRHRFGKTSKEHLRGQAADGGLPLALRLAAIAKVHGRYPTNMFAPGFVTFTPSAEELREELLGAREDRKLESDLRALRRALERAKRYRYFTESSTLRRLELLPGEWSTRKEAYGPAQS